MMMEAQATVAILTQVTRYRFTRCQPSFSAFLIRGLCVFMEAPSSLVSDRASTVSPLDHICSLYEIHYTFETVVVFSLLQTRLLCSSLLRGRNADLCHLSLLAQIFQLHDMSSV